MLWGFEGFGELFSLEKFPKRIPRLPDKPQFVVFIIAKIEFVCNIVLGHFYKKDVREKMTFVLTEDKKSSIIELQRLKRRLIICVIHPRSLRETRTLSI